MVSGKLWFAIAVLVLNILSISSSQSQPVSEKPTLKLTSLKWPGLADPSLPNMGYIPHAVSTAVERAGFSPELTIVPWARAVEKVKTGYADGFISVFMIWEPGFPTVKIEPFYVANIHFAARKNSEVSFERFEDLFGLSVAQLRGSWYDDRFHHSDRVNKVYVTNLKTGLRMVARKRVDLFIEPEHPLLYAIDQMPAVDQAKLTILPTPLTKHALGVRLGPQMVDNEEVIGRLNNAFREIKADGTLRSLMQEHKLRGTVEVP
ncbi:transporter substrate-binding domain-containing protein [Pseudomaricurvus alkylphenolicus]|uniref:substrate-binding periplasmic protein n=1 Tax=Pseudomaricurvus alkylphenolicus TaxID=1306991 RepID=UPI00141F7E68|nr:transporter substrate-binding domain-containing protein [Pseudomaricurvus alkylphenolicus]NIB38301.1 transporter substrate-binding domain-containing protein [Pseudomaricurvus alkylphenolicus]